MKFSSIAASAVEKAQAAVSKITGSVSTDNTKDIKSNQDHLRDLQSRLQIVANRTPSHKTPEMYGTSSNGFSETKKLTRAQRRAIQDKQMRAA